MPMNPRPAGIFPRAMVPMVPVPVPVPPVVCPPNNINMCLSKTMSYEYDSHIYGRFRHVERDYPHYRHIPFDWYQPPKQRHNVVHEDTAVVTHHGPVPIDEFYRYYIYGESMDDSDSDYYDDSTSFDSDDYYESSNEERSIGYRRQNRVESDFDDAASVNITYVN